MDTQEAREAIAELTYRSYCHHRRLLPELSPDSWSKIYDHATEYEQRYQSYLMLETDRRIEADRMAQDIKQEGHCGD